ncbi:hypothetical protein D9601_13975 [Sphingomonas sp. MA1305]|uniref:hypothetical protein n=1 Tax=Sphingomonas sp. MA1305 TaxID=2479204 RepID=UPI0018DF4386|nr:hypothetical protein [Sphingomonas sp. MA1305]MBI0476455.1 hypothetical protein [Sphingomonas sp. MA1305]
MARALKVFRTPIGFHDAYVAATSRKAALAAWGADVDLFARGAAEQVTDPDLIREPLAQPGVVIRKLRGSVDDHLAALPDTPRRPAAAKKVGEEGAPAKAKAQPKPKHKPKPKPRPSRADLDAAEQAIADADARFEAARRDIAAREAALVRERRALDADRERERAALESGRHDQEVAYREALARWRADQD